MNYQAPLLTARRLLGRPLRGNRRPGSDSDRAHRRPAIDAATPPTAPRTDCRILTNPLELEAIAHAWRDLHGRFGQDPFNDYDMIQAWWRTSGVSEGDCTLHVVAGFQNNILVAVLPLVVVKVCGLRIMRAGGNNSERFCDVLSDDDVAVEDVWQAARQSPAYDFAICRGVRSDSRSHKILARFARARDSLDEYYLASKWSEGEAWIASLSQKTRYNFNRCTRRMAERGPVRVETYEGGPPPVHIVEAMVEAKRAWCVANKRRSWMSHASTLDYYRAVCEVAAEKNRLFLAWLTCGDDLVAFQQGYIYQDVLYGEFTAYDPIWWSLSPGHVITVNTIRWAIEKGCNTVNLGPGNSTKRDEGENQYKQKYSNKIISGTEFTFSRSSRGKILEATYFMARSLWRRHRWRFDQRAARSSAGLRGGPNRNERC